MKNLEIGYISRAHGIRGEVFLRLYADKPTWSLAPKSFEVRTRAGDVLQASPESLRPHKQGLIIKFEECPDRNTSETWVGSKVYLPKDCFTSAADETPYYHELEGFRVEDKEGLELGTVKGLLFTGHQDLLRLNTDKGEVLIPYVDAFVLTQDRQNKILKVDLPEGLLDLQ